MNYYINLFSPTTYEAFCLSTKNISGFRKRQEKTASNVNIGDKFICYMTKISRWVGILEVISDHFIDNTPIFYKQDDPFIVRFKVNTITWLEKEKGVPIFEDIIWNNLSFTKGRKKGSHQWTGMVRNSLKVLQENDGKFLEEIIIEQASNGKTYPIDKTQYQKFLKYEIKTPRKIIQSTIPSIEEDELIEEKHIRESIKVQAQLAVIGEKMNFDIWIPKSDRNAVLQIWNPKREILENLPINYDNLTNNTIEQIDVLWIKGRTIIRAFEVEHTTSIISGILRMADLISLQPNINIKLHIVAPTSRREKVFQEISRPVFSLLEHGPLSDICTFISYESIEELSNQKLIAHFTDSVLDEFEEIAD